MNDSFKSTPLYKKTLGCLLGGLIGDAMGTPTEGKDYKFIDENHGWVSDFSGDGTDDTVMKNLLSEALVKTDGYATLDDWGRVWIENQNAFTGEKRNKFFISVQHTFNKLARVSYQPRMAALGNMPSSSSAMCISPVGIVNACNPKQAALQAYNLASLIHIHDVGFCQDGAASMAAAVAEAFKPSATVDSVIGSAVDSIIPMSGREILDLIKGVLSIARSKGDFKKFREEMYKQKDKYFRPIIADSRETIPLTIAILYLSGGDLEKCVTYGANFGRDADTIASMAGAIAGAFCGVDKIKKEWVEKVNKFSSLNQEGLATRLATTALKKMEKESQAQKILEGIST
jgi:ADP-ribosylglycohydrolase